MSGGTSGGRPLRVVQWTTGNVGRQSVQAMASNAEFEVVGCYAWSADKVGVDVGTLCGLEPVGVLATDDVDALLALRPDCVVYNPQWPSVDEMVRILEAGVNIVTTAAFITGKRWGDQRDRLQAACLAGGVSLFGSGVSPGFVEMLAIAAAGICDRIDAVRVFEEAYTTLYDSPTTERAAGFGHPIGHPGLHAMAAEGTAVFGEAVAMVADALGVELDEIVCESEFAAATTDIVMASWTIPAGHVAGVAASWQGRVRGRSVVELSVRWKKAPGLEPDWQLTRDGHRIVVEGRPTVTLDLGFMPPADFVAESLEDYMVIGHIITAMPVVNMIRPVVAARPGILTYADLPLPLPRGFVGGVA